MVTKLQYAKTADTQKRTSSSSSYQPKTINLQEQREQKKTIQVQKPKKSQAEKEYEKALKDLPSKNIPYEQRVEKFNKWFKENQGVLTDPKNIEKTRELLDREQRVQERSNLKEFEKITSEYKPTGDYAQRVEAVNTLIEENKDILGRGKNYDRTMELIAQEKSDLEAYEKSMPIKKAQEFDPNQYISYDWENKKAIIKNPGKYNIEYYSNGKIKSIKEKPDRYTKEYRRKDGKRSKKEYGTYTPKEIYFDEQGNITKEITYDTYTDYDKRWDGGSVRREKVFKSSEKIYRPGGILSSYKEWDAYQDKKEKEGKKSSSREKTYLESEKIYDTSGNLISKKEWDDIQTEYDKFKDGYEREREVYLETEYDYLKGEKRSYPSPDQEFMTYNLTQDEVKKAKTASKSNIKIKTDTLLTPEGKRIPSKNINWLKEQQESRGGIILPEGVYSEKQFKKAEDIVAVQKLIETKSDKGEKITNKDLMQALKTEKVSDLMQKSDLLEATTKYNKNLRVTQDINKLLQEKGGREGITAGELAKAAGGLSNLMPNYSSAKSMEDVKQLAKDKEQLLTAVSKIDQQGREYQKKLQKTEQELRQSLDKQPDIFDRRKSSVFTQKPILVDGELKYASPKLTQKQQMLIDIKDEPFEDEMSNLAKTQEKIQTITAKPEYRDFMGEYYKDETISKATKEKIRKGTDETFLENYRQDYNKIDQNDLIMLEAASKISQEQLKKIEKKESELKEKQTELISLYQRDEEIGKQLQKIEDDYTKGKIRGVQALTKRRDLEERRSKIREMIVERDPMVSARTPKLSTAEQIAKNTAEFNPLKSSTWRKIGSDIFGEKVIKPPKGKTLEEKNIEYVNKEKGFSDKFAELEFATAGTPIWRYSIGGIGRGIEYVGEKAENKLATGMQKGSNYLRNLEEKEQLKTGIMGNIKSKLFGDASDYLSFESKKTDFLGDVAQGFGGSLRKKPIKAGTELMIGLGTGFLTKAAPAITGGIRAVGGSAAVTTAKVGTRAALGVIGTQYAAGSTFRVMMAPKGEKGKPVGEITKEIVVMGAGASIGAKAAKPFERDFKIYEEFGKVKNRMGGPMLRSPVKVENLKGLTNIFRKKIKGVERPSPSIKFQTPFRVRTLDKSQKAFLSELKSSSKPYYGEVSPGKMKKLTKGQRKQAQLEYIQEIAGYSEPKFKKFTETGTNLPKSYVKPFLQEQTIFPTKLKSKDVSFREEGISEIKGKVVKSDIGYYKGEPIRAKKVDYKKIGETKDGKPIYREDVAFEGIYNKDLKLKMELSPEGQVLKKTLSSGKQQIVDLQAAEPKTIFEALPAQAKVVTSTETGIFPAKQKLSFRSLKELATSEQLKRPSRPAPKPDVIRETYMKFGKELVPSKLTEMPGDIFMLKAKKVPIAQASIRSLGSKTIKGDKVFIFETKAGKKIEVPEKFVQGKFIDAQYFNKYVLPFTRQKRTAFEFSEIKSGKDITEFATFARETKLDVTGAQIKASRTFEKMGPTEAQIFEQTGKPVKETGTILKVEDKGPAGDILTTRTKGDKVIEGVTPGKVGKSPVNLEQLKLSTQERLPQMGSTAQKAEPFYAYDYLKTQRPTATAQTREFLRLYSLEKRSTGFRKVPKIRDGKVSLDYLEFTKTASKKTKKILSDKIDFSTKPQQVKVIEKGKVDKKSMELFDSIGKRQKKETGDGVIQEQVSETVLEKASQYQIPKTKSRQVSKTEAIKDVQRATEGTTQRRLSKPKMQQRYRARNIPTEMFAPVSWYETRGEKEFIDQRTWPKESTLFEPKVRLQPKLNQNIRNEYRTNTLDNIKSSQKSFYTSDFKTFQEPTTDIKSRQDIKQFQEFKNINDFGDIGVIGGFPSIPSTPKPPKPPIPPEPIKPIPSFRFKKQKERKKPKPRTKEYVEREFSVLDILGAKKRGKGLSFI